MPRDWDADAYDRLPIPMTRWGHAVVDRMLLSGDERVLDAGCGTGQVTARLLARVPHGHVVALDASPSMIANARHRLGDERIEYLVADLMESLTIAPVDAIVSTATFHWIPDHDRLFTNLFEVLRPGGRLTAQCGGRGNIATITEVLRRLGHDREWSEVFPGPEETADRLREAGFIDVACSLRDEPTVLPRTDLELYLATVCLGGITDALSGEDAERLVREVSRSMVEPRIDYVRLNIDARKPG